MRSVNLLAKPPVSDYWKNHQVRAISKVVETAGRDLSATDFTPVEPLFPGSYLCNQLVVLQRGPGVSTVDAISCEASLDTIYEALSYSTGALFESYMLIDAEELDEVTKPLVLDAVCRNMEGVACLLVLDRNMLPTIEKLIGELPLRVEVVDPEWSNAASVISLYRNADYCIFVDTCRAMDAAVSGCILSLISSSAFVQNQSTNGLWYYLERHANCQLLGASATPVCSGKSVVAIVENSVDEIQHVLNGSDTTTYSDWLDEYRETPMYSRPVIAPNPSAWYKPNQNLLNLKLSLWRKTLKFSEDPKRFFSDSHIPVFKYLGKLIPTREAA